jgi:hypothetical protein
MNLQFYTLQAAADAKYYGNSEVYYMLKARGAKVPVPYISLNVYVSINC